MRDDQKIIIWFIERVLKTALSLILKIRLGKVKVEDGKVKEY